MSANKQSVQVISLLGISTADLELVGARHLLTTARLLSAIPCSIGPVLNPHSDAHSDFTA